MVFNILSILSGIAAVAMPIVAFIVKGSNKRRISNISLSACVISLFCQLAEYNSRVMKRDWTALSDTSSAVIFVSAILILTVFVLNLLLYRTELPNSAKGIDRR